MKTKQRIFLIGFMGSGKSTLGNELANQLNYKYIDTDAWIEENEKRKISEIFETSGEDYFRKKEREALLSVIQKERIVIATGGGLPCFFDNMKIITNNGTSFFLEIQPEDLLERLKGETNHRPLLSEKKETELLEWMEYKLNERNVFYSNADYTINGNLPVDSLIHEIVKKIHV